MTASATGWADSILDAVDTAFAALTAEPAPLSLDLDKLGLTSADDSDLPAGVIALPALQSWLLKHRRAYTVHDGVCAELIRRARLDGWAWVVGPTAMAMPALRRAAAHRLVRRRPPPDAEILTGVLSDRHLHCQRSTDLVRQACVRHS